ncbi:MAG: hypothetical protein ACREBC_09640, partial [Pyrinomonadaceae bacterium]
HELVYGNKDYPKAIQLAKAVLAEEPDNLKVLIDVSYAGYASKAESYRTDTLTFAKRAIQLIESGKTLENWNPYVSKEEALGYLYNAIGSLNLRNIAEALPILIKGAQFEGKIKTLPYTYGTIAEAYEAGPYAKLSAEYKAKYGGKDETPESKIALENIYQIISDNRSDDRRLCACGCPGWQRSSIPSRQKGMDGQFDNLVQIPEQPNGCRSQRIDRRHSGEASAAHATSDVITDPYSADTAAIRI